MRNFVIGDIQGCFTEFMKLLELINFNPETDKLWLAGDMINRGPDSLAVMDFLINHQESIISVLGNHELHFLAIANNLRHPSRNDSMEELLASPMLPEIIAWLRKTPLIYYNNDFNAVLVHAGIYPHWTLHQALNYGLEMHQLLLSNQWQDVLSNMYGNEPVKPETIKTKAERHRFLLNVFTRMRYCTADGGLELKVKVSPGMQPDHLIPWYELIKQHQTPYRIFFGHWASLGIHIHKGITCLDSGCVWGRTLTAFCIETNEFLSVPATKI
jgi:bis(5'-nucleosyl)-tetraphosphatase (symmetrical)